MGSRTLLVHTSRFLFSLVHSLWRKLRESDATHHGGENGCQMGLSYLWISHDTLQQGKFQICGRPHASQIRGRTNECHVDSKIPLGQGPLSILSTMCRLFQCARIYIIKGATSHIQTIAFFSSSRQIVASGWWENGAFSWIATKNQSLDGRCAGGGDRGRSYR